jgi:hypothetical protein
MNHARLPLGETKAQCDDYLSVGHHGMALHLPKFCVKGLKSVLYSMQWIGLVMLHCGMRVRSLETVAVSVRKMKAPTVKLDTTNSDGTERERQALTG